MKLAVFDFDSTLMDGETIEFLAQELNLKEQVAEITAKAMNGKLDFFESLTYRVKLLKGLPVSKVDKICHNLPMMKGGKETISELKTSASAAVSKMQLNTLKISSDMMHLSQIYCTQKIIPSQDWSAVR